MSKFWIGKWTPFQKTLNIVSAIFAGGCLNSLASWKQTADDRSPILGSGGYENFELGCTVPG